MTTHLLATRLNSIRAAVVNSVFQNVARVNHGERFVSEGQMVSVAYNVNVECGSPYVNVDCSCKWMHS